MMLQRARAHTHNYHDKETKVLFHTNTKMDGNGDEDRRLFERGFKEVVGKGIIHKPYPILPGR